MKVEYRSKHAPVKLELRVPMMLYIYDKQERVSFYIFPRDSQMAEWALSPVRNRLGVLVINPELYKWFAGPLSDKYKVPHNYNVVENIVSICSNV